MHLLYNTLTIHTGGGYPYTAEDPGFVIEVILDSKDTTYNLSPKLVLVTEDSEFYRLTHEKQFLSVFYSIGKDNVTIYANDPASKDLLSQALSRHVDRIKNHFSKQNLFVELLDEKLFRTNARAAQENGTEKTQGGGRLEGKLNNEFIESNFIVGEPNETAYNIINMMASGSGAPIMYLFGPSGSGKSHLFHQTAWKIYQNGGSVYFSSAADLVNRVKASFSGKKSYPGIVLQHSAVFIEDSQKLRKVNWIEETFFEIIDKIINEGKKIFLSSDEMPQRTTFTFHERLRSRIMSGYVVRINYPDKDLKRQFVDQFCEENSLLLNSAIKEHIVNMAVTLRFAKGILVLCQAMEETKKKNLSVDSFVELMTTNFGSPDGFMEYEKNKVLPSLINLFETYYGVFKKPVAIGEKTAKRKSAERFFIDSTIYYLLYGKVNTTLLRNSLHVTRSNHSFCKAQGKINFESIDDISFKREILAILEEYKVPVQEA